MRPEDKIDLDHARAHHENERFDQLRALQRQRKLDEASISKGFYIVGPDGKLIEAPVVPPGILKD